MQFTLTSAALLAFVASVVAQDPTAGFDVLTSPSMDQNVPAGQPLNIVWQPGTFQEGTATIQLLQGESPATLSPGLVVKAGIANNAGSYSWDVPTNLESFATYGFTITLDGSKDPVIFQYSFPFHITGLTNGTEASASSASGTYTVHLGTGTAYTPKPTANSTSPVPTPSSNITMATPRPSSNITLPTTIATANPTTSSQASPTSGPPPEQSTNAAIANAATGSLALIGALVIAFAL